MECVCLLECACSLSAALSTPVTGTPAPPAPLADVPTEAELIEQLCPTRTAALLNNLKVGCVAVPLALPGSRSAP